MDEETRERGTRETASTKPTELIQDAGFRSTPPGLSGESKPSLKRGGWRSFTKGPSISMDSLMESFEKMHLIDVPRHPRVIAKPISQIMRMSGAARDAHAKYRLSLVPNSAIVKLPDPLEGIVFHYEKFSALSSGQTCEAAYLCSLGISVQILVSLSSLHHMEKAYGSIFGLPANVEKPVVKPLFFTEKQLMLKRVKTFLAAGEGAMPVYMEVVCKILEKMALEKKRAAGSDYAAFKARIASEVLDEQQSRSLNTRLDLLERFVGLRNDPVTAKNAAKTTKRVRIDTGESSVDDEDIWSFRPGSLTIVDLRCPHVDEDVACSLFNLCLPLFLENRGESCCIVALDEAQKFLTGTVAASILTESLLQVIRQQQNLEIIATQEPSISPQLLDLSSMTIVHRFTSISWLKELKQHFAGFSSFEGPSSENLLDIAALISDLKESEALLFCLSDMLDTENEERFGGIVKKVRKLRSRYFVHRMTAMLHSAYENSSHNLIHSCDN